MKSVSAQGGRAVRRLGRTRHRLPGHDRRDGLDQAFAGGGLRQMGGKARFAAPLDVFLLPIAAQRNAGEACARAGAVRASGHGRCRPAVRDR